VEILACFHILTQHVVFNIYLLIGQICRICYYVVSQFDVSYVSMSAISQTSLSQAFWQKS